MRRLAAALGVWFCLCAPAIADKRVALVIGNSAYRHAPALRNPANDAADMAAALERLGFEVVRGLDLDFVGMRNAIRQFGETLAGSDVALLFYAGHGVQVGGKNYLAPIDAKLENQTDLDFGTFDLDLALRGMEAVKRTSIVFLDACRDNVLAQNLAGRVGTRSGATTRGLARVDTGVGTLIAYATQPGNVALDGDGRNSPFTGALLKSIEQPGLPLGEVMIAVRNEVLRATDGKQVPWDHSSLTGKFYFTAPSAGGAPPGATAADPAGLEVAFWNSIQGAKNPQLYEAYLKRYPNGTFADIARINLSAVKLAAAKPIAEQPAEKVVLGDPATLRELRERLYELNFDPSAADANGLRVAIQEFETQTGLPRNGQPTDGLLRRLRELGGLKPWGAIVYDKGGGKWGMSWSHASRKDAVAGARSNCGAPQCAAELSFFGTGCGAFAASATGSWSMAARDDAQRARQAVLDDCGKRGKSCRVVGAVCADGAGRVQ